MVIVAQWKNGADMVCARTYTPAAAHSPHRPRTRRQRPEKPNVDNVSSNMKQVGGERVAVGGRGAATAATWAPCKVQALSSEQRWARREQKVSPAAHLATHCAHPPKTRGKEDG